MTSLVEGSLWKLKSSMTGSSWKKHWVSTDGVKINQWHARLKPPPTEPPKYSLFLKDCQVSDHQGRKYCFKISEKNSNLTLIFAVDDFDSYERWLKILITKDADLVELDSGPFEEEVEDNEEEQQPEHSIHEIGDQRVPMDEAPPDFIFEYFKEHDVFEVRILVEISHICPFVNIFPCFLLIRMPEILASRSTR